MKINLEMQLKFNFLFVLGVRPKLSKREDYRVKDKEEGDHCLEF